MEIVSLMQTEQQIEMAVYSSDGEPQPFYIIIEVMDGQDTEVSAAGPFRSPADPGLNAVIRTFAGVLDDVCYGGSQPVSVRLKKVWQMEQVD